MSDILFTFEDGGEVLMHHGVKGMKWGVRNAETKRKYAKNAKEKVAQAKDSVRKAKTDPEYRRHLAKKGGKTVAKKAGFAVAKRVAGSAASATLGAMGYKSLKAAINNKESRKQLAKTALKKAASTAAGQALGSVAGSVATYAIANPVMAVGIGSAAVGALAGTGYLAYRALSSKERTSEKKSERTRKPAGYPSQFQQLNLHMHNMQVSQMEEAGRQVVFQQLHPM